MSDPLDDLDAGLERDMEDALDEGAFFWEQQLKLLDAGEEVTDVVTQKPMSRAEILEILGVIKEAERD